MFDEPSSFLDIKQRMTATDVIRRYENIAQPALTTKFAIFLNVDEFCSLITEGDEASIRGTSASRYVICVEHDLAVLDYMSDYVCCLYGEPGGYGVVTKIATVRDGIHS